MNDISDEARRIFEVVNFVFISCVIGLFGIVANIINIIIFYKQGFRNTVNIGFFGLAISDLCCLVALIWISICMNPLIASSNAHWQQADVMYLSGAWLHACFGRITSYITGYITAERYFSIAMPLKVRDIFTPKLTTVIICACYVINLLTLVPEYATSYLGWKFVPAKNGTYLTLAFTTSKSSVEGLVYVLHSVFGIGSFVAVICFTVILVIKLKRTAQWRKKAVSGQDKSTAMATRDRKTVKMIALIAIILIICYIPGAIIAMATFVVGSEFGIKGSYINIFLAVWSIAVCFQAVNSSINILLYYNMSSKYRRTFCVICCSTVADD